MINHPQQYQNQYTAASPSLPPPPSQYTAARTPPRPIDNRPAWLTEVKSPGPSKRVDFDLKDKPLEEEPDHKQGSLYVVAARIFISKLATQHAIRPMPLDLDNGLPGILMRVGLAQDNDTCFLCHVDSCAAMNTGNLLLHQYIITKHPHTVAEYIQYDDNEPFEPIHLECAVENSEAIEKERGKLTAVVRYHTPYTEEDGKPVLLSFGLGAGVAVRSIIGKPTLQKWKCVLDFANNKLMAPGLGRQFQLTYEEARQGLPQGVDSQRTKFQRPCDANQQPQQEADLHMLSAITDGCNEALSANPSACTTREDTSKGYLQRSVQEQE